MPDTHPRLRREKVTIQKMIVLYCHENHGTQGEQLCADCQELKSYSEDRLKHCPFQENKSTCAKCAVHCYKPVMREKTRTMMRFSGPKMLLRYPLLAILHLLDGFRPQPAIKKK
jgi:hypothetical protein